MEAKSGGQSSLVTPTPTIKFVLAKLMNPTGDRPNSRAVTADAYVGAQVNDAEEKERCGRLVDVLPVASRNLSQARWSAKRTQLFLHPPSNLPAPKCRSKGPRVADPAVATASEAGPRHLNDIVRDMRILQLLAPTAVYQSTMRFSPEKHFPGYFPNAIANRPKLQV